MAWYWWVLLIYLFIGAALFIAGKILNPKAKLPLLTPLVVLTCWLPMILLTIYDGLKPKPKTRP
jgi:putative effector of murein hydrolase